MSVSKKLLIKDQDSDLAKLFSGKIELNTLADGRIFLDRNPKVFGMMIDYLSNDSVIGPIKDELKMSQFKTELEHWKIRNNFKKAKMQEDLLTQPPQNMEI